MALALNPRADRLLKRLPRFTVYSALELLLLALIAVQCARLFWALLTPAGPVGDWRAPDAQPAATANAAAIGSFDPFFRLAPGAAAAPVTVTALDIRLFGTREDRATGRGTAFIAGPDGVQRSFMVGEEIMPGVVLTAVGFDSVTVTRGGGQEQLFLDQSPLPVNNQPGGALPPQPGFAPQQPVVVQPPPPPPPPANQAQPQRPNP
jgi:general secretion pathway protein C